MALQNGAPRVGRRRLIVFYSVLGATTIAVVATVLAIGSGKHPATPIAGGYDLTAGTACLGAKVDVSQSGRYVGIDNAQSSIGGKLTLEGSHLTGTVDCVNGKSAKLDAVSSSGALRGTVDGQPLDAALRRDPPAPGSLKQRAPG